MRLNVKGYRQQTASIRTRLNHGSTYLSGGFGLAYSAIVSLLVPLRADELGASIASIAILVSARAVSQVVLAMPVGGIIGWIGAKAAFIVGTLGCAAVAVGFALAVDYLVLLALNVVAGGLRTLAWVSSQTIVSAAPTPEERARNTGRFSFVGNAGQMAAPALAGVVAASQGYRMGFVAMAAYSVLFALVGFLLPKRQRVKAKERVPLRNARHLVTIPGIQIAMLLTFVRLWVPSVWTPFFPLFLVSAGVSVGLAGAVISGSAAVAMVVSLLTGWLSRFAARDILCTIALGVSVVALFISPFTLSMPAAFLPAALVGVGNGLSLPLLIVLTSEAAPPGQRPLALAARQTINSAASAIAPLGIGTLVSSTGVVAGFGLSAGVASIVLAVVLVLSTRQTRDGAGRPGCRPQCE